MTAAPLGLELPALHPVDGAGTVESSGASRVSPAWRAALVAGPLSFVVAALGGRVLSLDSLYALYAGRVVAHGLPQHESLTTAALGRPWVDQQWLAQWILFQTFSLGGYRLLTLLAALLVMVAMALLAATMVGAGTRPGAAVAASTGALVVMVMTPLVRTQTFGFPLFAAMLWILLPLLRAPAWRRRTVLVIPLLMLWGNLHGSVTTGVAVAVAVFGCAAVRSLRGNRALAAAYTLLAAGSVLASLVTPYGARIVRYYSSMLGSGVLHRNVSEWQPLSLGAWYCWPFLCLLVATLVLVAVAHRRAAHPPGCWPELALAGVMSVLAFYTTRYMFWAAFTLAYVAATHGPQPHRSVRPWVRAVGSCVLVPVVLASVIGVLREPTTEFLASTPTALADAAAQVSASSGTVVLADAAVSAALLWRHPSMRGHVAFDIRFEQYDQAELRHYFSFLYGKNPRFACRFGALAISRHERPHLVDWVSHSPAWRTVWSDRSGIVAVRDGASCP